MADSAGAATEGAKNILSSPGIPLLKGGDISGHLELLWYLLAATYSHARHVWLQRKRLLLRGWLRALYWAKVRRRQAMTAWSAGRP